MYNFFFLLDLVSNESIFSNIFDWVSQPPQALAFSMALIYADEKAELDILVHSLPILRQTWQTWWYICAEPENQPWQ